ncbi:restriction endonuclease subunit S [Helicobacter pylori]|uniref:Restriction endonuclease subunit S n=2 Tax=Helicobacter pylori TaxID=210 RepID=A0ABD7CED0_HELPX|nr:restriction endonuclease subunit S [Helicobacter pylori]QQX00255.1 restriction endonuclease subunit S [Helicobacter pylori]
MLPLNWQRVRLGDMTTSFTKQTGFDYSAFIKPTLIKEYLPNYIPFIQNKDFLGHYINYKTDYFIPNEIAIRFPQILLNEKCLLISISGAIGNVAVFNHSQDAFTGGAIAVLKFKEKKSLDFVMHFLMSASGQKLLLNGVKSSSHKNLTIADLRNLLIPLPPLNEQIAIANILSGLDCYLCALDALILKKEGVKKALSFELLSQRKRLKGFNQAWQRVRLGDILSYEQPTKYLVATTQYLQKGFTPILTAGKTFTLGYTNDKHGIYTNIPVIIFDDFTTDSKMVNFPFKVKSSAIKILSLRDNNQADLKYIYEKLTLLKHQVTDHKRYWIDEFSNFEILLPPLNEQNAIANILSALDNEITSLKNKKRQFENIKKALNHDLMSAKIRVLEK